MEWTVCPIVTIGHCKQRRLLSISLHDEHTVLNPIPRAPAWSLLPESR
jgi:hypothetical protein